MIGCIEWREKVEQEQKILRGEIRYLLNDVAKLRDYVHRELSQRDLTHDCSTEKSRTAQEKFDADVRSLDAIRQCVRAGVLTPEDFLKSYDHYRAALCGE